MAIPKIEKQDIINALKYIDENETPSQNQSTKYELISEDGKRYSPKYVVAVADHIANGSMISTEKFNAIEAKLFLEGMGFSIAPIKQKKFELVITADSVVSTDERFTMDNLGLGDNYKPLDAYYKKTDGTKIRRLYNKGERKISNQTMPRIAFQIFEEEISALSIEDKEQFPIYSYNSSRDMIRGIFSSKDDFKRYRNSEEFTTYNYDSGRQFVIYCWNIFSTVIFVQECLKRFGEPGDQFVLIYRDKDEKEEVEPAKPILPPNNGYRNSFSYVLIESHNLILRGAPGTGKSYLAKEIATDIVSNGYFDDYLLLSDEQKKQVEFVQFHPNYDYSDFVEGLRPKVNTDGSMGFELQDGIFKKFVARARKNYEDSQKSKDKYVFIIDEINRGEISKIFGELFFAIDPGYRGRAGEISTQYSNMHSNPDDKFYVPENVYIVGTMNDIDRSVDSFDFAMRRRFRFVELKADDCLEMLASLNDEELEKEAIERMTALNREIANVEDLNENYQIGASYFLKLKTLNFDQLWTDYLQPLLKEYVQGMYDEEGIMDKLAKAYGYKEPTEGNVNETPQD